MLSTHDTQLPDEYRVKPGCQSRSVHSGQVVCPGSHLSGLQHLVCLTVKNLSALSLILAIFLLNAGCANNSGGMKKYSYNCLGSFDTVITIMGYSASQREFDEWAAKAEARFLELHQLYDGYHLYEGIPNIKTINDQAGLQPVKVAADLYNLIETTLAWQADSPGVVNIALGSVLQIWHDYRTVGLADPAQATVPPAAELAEAAKHTDSSEIILDQTAQTVYLSDPDMSLDVGAVAKGYATELVARELKEAGWQSFIISSGGNVRAIDKPAVDNRSKWAIGIQNPDWNESSDESVEDLLDTIYLVDSSVVTSGDYQRYYTVKGKKYHHIIDPVTLMPADQFKSVSVITQDSGLADFLSTTFFILPYEQGLAYAESLDQVEVMWVLQDGTVKMTAGLSSMSKNAGATAD